MTIHSMRILMAGLLLSGTHPLYAEDITAIRGIIRDAETGAPIEYAYAILRASENAVLIKGSNSNAKGEFIISEINAGEYLLEISNIGYQKENNYPVKVSPGKTTDIGTVHLKPDVTALEGARVTFRKKFVEQTIDKTIINVEASPTSAGENVLETLKKVPGITLDKDDNISLKGKQGITVMIDGRQTYMGGSQLANFLRNMQSSSVEKIEVIENPSSRFDAEGTSGILDIRTKKIRIGGFNGSINGGLNYRMRTTYNGGISLNYRRDRWNLFGNLSGQNDQGRVGLFVNRNFYNPAGDYSGSMSQDVWIDYPSEGSSYQAGADFKISNRHMIGVLFRGNINENSEDHRGTTLITNAAEEQDSGLWVRSRNEGLYRRWTQNLNYKWAIDSTGRELTFDGDYAIVNNTEFSGMTSESFDNLSFPTGRIIAWNTGQPTKIDIVSLKADYVHPFSGNTKLEAGIKTSFVKTDNQILFQELQQGIWTPDPTKSDHFIYKETIHAAYASLSGQIKTTSVQVGLRAEQTLWEGDSKALHQVRDSSYLNLFPTVFLMQPLNQNHNLKLSYSYRIGRPRYEQLNPFLYYLDPYTYNKGNPFLQPQFTHSMQFSHSWKQIFTTTASLGYTKDAISQILYQDENTMAGMVSYSNLSDSYNANLTLNAQIPIFSWWTLMTNLSGSYGDWKTQYMNEIVTNNRLQGYLWAQNVFTLPKDYVIEISGWYQTRGSEGMINFQDMGSLDLGIQKKILKQKGTLRLSVSDLLKTSQPKEVGAQYSNVDFIQRNDRETRKFSLTFNYQFGKTDIKPARQRKTASEEEQSRI